MFLGKVQLFILKPLKFLVLHGHFTNLIFSKLYIKTFMIISEFRV